MALSTTRQPFNQLTKEHILEMCSNMIVFDPTLDTFRFAHLSVREFLEKRAEYTKEATNDLTAERCLLDILNAVDMMDDIIEGEELDCYEYGGARL